MLVRIAAALPAWADAAPFREVPYAIDDAWADQGGDEQPFSTRCMRHAPVGAGAGRSKLKSPPLVSRLQKPWGLFDARKKVVLPVEAMIEEREPETGKELEQMAARILREAGFTVVCQAKVRLVRGSANVDLMFVDDGGTPPATVLIECKHWKTRVTQSMVHAFRTIVTDAGASRGLLLSSAGFQSGAKQAAKQSNVDLITWREFEGIYEARWTDRHVRPRLNLVFPSLLELAQTYCADEDYRLQPLSSEQVQAVWDRAGKIEPLARFAEKLYFRDDFSVFSAPCHPVALPLAVHRDGMDLAEIPAHLHAIQAIRPFFEAMMIEGCAASEDIDRIIESAEPTAEEGAAG